MCLFTSIRTERAMRQGHSAPARVEKASKRELTRSTAAFGAEEATIELSVDNGRAIEGSMSGLSVVRRWSRMRSLHRYTAQLPKPLG